MEDRSGPASAMVYSTTLVGIYPVCCVVYHSSYNAAESELHRSAHFFIDGTVLNGNQHVKCGYGYLAMSVPLRELLNNFAPL
jgi:hypothetical protein